MSNHSSEVEINGKRYDAITGQLIGVHKKAARFSQNQFSMDGIMRTPAITIKTAAQKAHPKRVVSKLKNRTQTSKTLMRRAVGKPSTKILRTSKKISSAKSERLSRAKTTLKHAKVRKFGLPAKTTHITNAEVISPSKKTTSKASAANSKAVVSTSSHQQLERLLDYALARADAHKKAMKKAKRGPMKIFDRFPRWINIILLVAIVGGVGGFTAWQKMPELSLKLANHAAHVDASIPTYTPSGYQLSGLPEANNGTVTITYKSTLNPQKTYTVKQASVTQDNSIADTTSSSSAQVQTTQSHGVSISIVKDGQKNMAMCANGGRQTILNDNAGLSPIDITNTLSSVC